MLLWLFQCEDFLGPSRNGELVGILHWPFFKHIPVLVQGCVLDCHYYSLLMNQTIWNFNIPLGLRMGYHTCHLFNCTAEGGSGSWFCFAFFFIFYFSFVSKQIQTPTRPIVVTGWCHHQPIGHFSALFLSPLRRAFCQVSKLTIQTEHGRPWEMFGQNWAKIPQRCTSGHLQG